MNLPICGSLIATTLAFAVAWSSVEAQSGSARSITRLDSALDAILAPTAQLQVVKEAFRRNGGTRLGETWTVPAVQRHGRKPDLQVEKIVVVKPEPGYAPNPGHRGYGTVLFQVCSR